jgi:hypothetical protein
MLNKTMIEWLKELPEDYDICFSEYTSIVVGEDSTSDEYFVVLDCPIVGLLKNDETKEIRFFTKTSEERVIKQIEDGKEWRKLE